MDRPRTSRTAPTLRRSRLHRALLVAAGSCALGLGVAGVALPVLPTTPFVLLAAACFARSSRRLHAWLILNPLFGRVLRDYRHGRGVPLRTKLVAMATVAVSIGASAFLAVPAGLWPLRVVLIGIGCAVMLHIGRLRSRGSAGSGGPPGPARRAAPLT